MNSTRTYSPDDFLPGITAMRLSPISKALANTYADKGLNEESPAHVIGLEHREGFGSFVKGVNSRASLEEFFTDVSKYGCREVPHEEIEAVHSGATLPICTYYNFIIPPQYDAREGVVKIGDLLAKLEEGARLPNVCIRRSRHNVTLLDDKGNPAGTAPTMELYMDDASVDDMPKATHGWIIVGPGKSGEQIVWTWYPGDISSAPTTEAVQYLNGILVKL
jgi:hypothetical protein